MNICVGHSLQTVSLSLFRKMLSTQFSVRKWQGIWDACKCLLDGQYLLRFFWVKKQEQEDKNCIGRLKPHVPLGHSKRRVFLCLKTVCGFCFYFVCVCVVFLFISCCFFSIPWHAAFICSGNSGLETKAEEAGEHWAALATPCPAMWARVGELWPGFVALMDVVHCSLWTVSNLSTPLPCCCCWLCLLCLWMWQSNPSEAQLACWSVSPPALLQREPSWQQQALCWFLGRLYQSIEVWTSPRYMPA